MPEIEIKLPPFEITGVKPGFHVQEKNGQSAFETPTETSFPGKWRLFFFYPKDLTFVWRTEIAKFAQLSKDTAYRDAVVLGGSTNIEFCNVAWRREHKDLHHGRLSQFAGNKGALVDGPGRQSPDGVAHRYRVVVDPTTPSSTFMRPI